jgi:SPP1 family predicted phage head-tail adaptor
MAGGPLTSRGGGQNRKTVGRMRHRVTIQRVDESTRDVAGAVVPAWVAVDTVWASVEPVSGREIFASGQVQANVTHRVVIRHREDVTAKNRLVWVTSKPAGQVLNIVAAPPEVGCGNSIEIMCVREETAV